MFNYLYADLFMMIVNPAAYQNAVVIMPVGIMVGATLLMEILIVMVLVSRVFHKESFLSICFSELKRGWRRNFV